MMVELFDYQRKALQEVNASLDEHRRVVLQMPTGSGKTVTAAEFVRREAQKHVVWFICHRREIIRQASRAFSELGIRHGIIAPDAEKMRLGFAFDPTARVKIASIQTLANRVDEFDPPAVVVWDECHHIAADSWARLLARFPEAKHVGLTATPERLDGKGLVTWFPEMVLGPSIRQLIDKGRLAPYRMFAPTEPDMRSARIKLGDYLQADTERIMSAPVIIGDAVEHYKRAIPASRALVFATSVAASLAVVEQFGAEGIAAQHVDGTTPDEVRDEAISNLVAGKIKILSSYGVFTEGVDVPEVDAVILLRPTKSLQLYLQMIGRGLRYVPGKVLTIMDHAGLYHEHGLPDADWQWSLEGGARNRRVEAFRAGAERLRKCPNCKHVHVPAATCAQCGFDYPTGRYAEQFDGILIEVGAIPPGCETFSAFARHAGISRTGLRRLIAKGLPVVDGRYVATADGEGWLASNYSARKYQAVPEPIIGHISLAEFGRRFSISGTAVRGLAKRGLPLDRDGMVIIDDAARWLKENWNSIKRAPVDADRAEVLNKTDFARLAGISKTLLYRSISAGMPTTSNGWIRVQDGLDWLKVENRKYLPPRVRNPAEFETRTNFAKRIGVSQPMPAYWAKRGLPCAPNGWVHIQRGLEWVRDNTELVVPVEAWPPIHQEAAE
ncbi:superfamily II DNA or RNA helicase [Mesorhizobium loti]|uniref:Superfamily II DNA or RNA helicase n=1 Tax=Rhizobium loti TaxID=381 RepID=A0A8E2WFP8_RHILI|nr:DEAD/DEAH box helicase [Mesorhizobium loti]PWJ93598.1 superfamily II DNA or RNA helicase [Mesorhizobium loti]